MINCQTRYSYGNQSKTDQKSQNRAIDCENTLCQTPSGDLLAGRRKFLYSSSTCGLKYPERYCILGTKTQIALKRGRMQNVQNKIVKRSLPRDEGSCHICDSRVPYEQGPQSHRIEMIVSGDYTDPSKRWWQSENNKDNVYIQFELENQFILSYIFMKFKTFRPASMFIEKSSDYGVTWNQIAYYADDCKDAFPDVPKYSGQTLRMAKLGVAVCKEIYSRGDPSKDRALVHRVLEPNKIKKIDLYSTDNLDALKVTNVRFNFTKLFRLGDQYFFDEDAEYYEKYYYSLNQISIYGSCMCYGHASKCKIMDDTIEYDRQDLQQMTHAACECKHNTAGLNCELCLPLYNARPWAAATIDDANSCKKCECNGHAEECEFDKNEYDKSGGENGGICKCLHNTHGINCGECKVGFWKDSNVPYTRRDACKGKKLNSFINQQQF